MSVIFLEHAINLNLLYRIRHKSFVKILCQTWRPIFMLDFQFKPQSIILIIGNIHNNIHFIAKTGIVVWGGADKS